MYKCWVFGISVLLFAMTFFFSTKYIYTVCINTNKGVHTVVTILNSHMNTVDCVSMDVIVCFCIMCILCLNIMSFLKKIALCILVEVK